jgi:hypothetical protein
VDARFEFAKNPNKLPIARQWYERAASSGHPAAIFHLGEMTENGEATSQDFGKADLPGIFEPFIPGKRLGWESNDIAA